MPYSCFLNNRAKYGTIERFLCFARIVTRLERVPKARKEVEESFQGKLKDEQGAITKGVHE